MKASPRRPLILKRRKRPLTFSSPVDTKDTAREEKAFGSQDKALDGDFDTANTFPSNDILGTSQKNPATAVQKFPEGIRIVNHPSIPDTQVVLIPRNADLQSIIAALTTKGKESGSNGPKKFILLSGNATSSRQSLPLESNDPSLTQGSLSNVPEGRQKSLELQEEPSVKDGEVASLGAANGVGIKKEESCTPRVPEALVLSALCDPDTNTAPAATDRLLDDSLTNIQWLGKMSTDGLGACHVKDEAEKENNEPAPQGPTPETVHERPPYSYMAMIQFAINSTQSKRMTLKEIYTWIEDHFPYFKHVAKPGWKNSIRHNLSLHDMFIRQTSHNGKISHWTIRAEANRFLTLDQVVKIKAGVTRRDRQNLWGEGMGDVSVPKRHPFLLSKFNPADKHHWIQAAPVLVCQQQQKRSNSIEAPKSSVAISTEANLRKMKPLLPRTDSYLVPIQLPVTTTPLILQPSPHLSLPAITGHPSTSTGQDLPRKHKRVRIAPKVPNDTLSCNPLVLTVKLPENPPLLAAPASAVMDGCAAVRLGEAAKESGSRRKQRHVLQSLEEPVLLFPEVREPTAEVGLDSGLVSDLSTFHESRNLEQCPDFANASVEYNFKTPIKERPRDAPASSTPSRGAGGGSPVTVANSWKIALTPLKKDDSLFEFSPVRTPHGSFLTPLRNDTGSLSLSSTPFKEFALFESPRELLNSPVGEPEHEVGFSPLPHDKGQLNAAVNRSLTEGLVLDTLNESLSKILLDISFTGLEDEDYELSNMSWSALIPELR